VAVALAASFLTLYAVTRIWSEIFWKPRPSDEPIDSRPSRGSLGLELVPVGVLAIITVALGIAAAPLWEFVARTAEQLLDPSAYIQAVLGGSR
jgi:multicomponent Na+:H+ antiporter subunit D